MSNTVYEHEWREMRKGIAEIKRRAQVSKGIHRYYSKGSQNASLCLYKEGMGNSYNHSSWLRPIG